MKILDGQSKSTLAMLAPWLIGNCHILFAPRLSDDQDAKTQPIEDEGSSDKKITKSGTKRKNIGMNTDGSSGRQAGKLQVEENALDIRPSKVTIP